MNTQLQLNAGIALDSSEGFARIGRRHPLPTPPRRDSAGARALRSGCWQRIVLSLRQAVVAVVQGPLVRYRQRRAMTSTVIALRDLDQHQLRDLGFDRSEIESVAVEVTGAVDTTRARLLGADLDRAF